MNLLAAGLGAELVIGVLNSQAPNVEVVTDGHDNIDDEAAIDTKSNTKDEKNERNLVFVVSKGARPTNAESLDENRTKRVDNTAR